MRKFLHLIILCLLNGVFLANTKPTMGFIENKGQIHDQNFKPNTEVKYLLCVPGMNIQLKQNSFSYDTYTVEQKNTETTRETPLAKLKRPAVENTYHFHRVDIEFIGASAQPEIIAESPGETYYNFYTTGTSEQGATNVRSYEKVTYKNIYPNIDLEFVAKNGKMKYNFILHYGAEMNVIKWKYHGADNTEIKNSNISIAVKQGEFNEAIPESYVEYQNTHSDVRINFKQEKNTFGFLSDEKLSINKGEILVIDPVLNILWATYFGGTKTDFIWTSCFDGLQNLCFVGGTNSTNSIATTGAFQTTFAGGPYDGMLFKFNSNGVKLWATYFGGNGDDFIYGLANDKTGNIFISGVTSSTSSIATMGSYQTSYGGGPYDAFIAKFTSTGSLIWSTYFGSSGDDESLSCKMDTIGNIFISGFTSSPLGIGTVGSYQNTYGGGPYDGFFSKFSTNGNLIWSSYYGGTDDDGIESMEFDKSNNFYFEGQTKSNNAISTTGSHQQGYSGGDYDGFIAKFNNTGLRKWSTYYGGCGKEVIWDIKCDSLGYVYISGNTTSIDSIASLGAHQTVYGGTGLGNHGDAFLVKFDTNGIRLWATYYGGGNNENGISIAFKNTNVYLSGVTQSLNQISTPPNVYQSTLNSPYADMFLVKFNQGGVRQWGTYIGGSTNDIPYNLLINQAGDIYICGTSDGPFPVTVGAYQTTLNGMIEGIILKLRENSSVTSVLEINQSYFDLTVYPNPNSGSFTIQTKEDVVLEIVNELGQLVKTIKLDAGNNHQTTITGLADGVYCLKDKLRGNVIKNKIVVVK